MPDITGQLILVQKFVVAKVVVDLSIVPSPHEDLLSEEVFSKKFDRFNLIRGMFSLLIIF